jgi:hypothetical protein
MSLDEGEMEAAVDRHSDWLLQHSGVYGCAIAEEGVRVYCSEEVPEAVRQEIRERFAPIPVHFARSGPIQAY